MTPDPKTVFAIFRNRAGQWCARRSDGLVFGTFRERDGALRFARRECRNGGPPTLVF
ncbi:MAG TPA: hypothetical protein VGC36_11835 [Rhizomicrobium sp.]